MNLTYQTQNEGTLRRALQSPGRHLPLGVAVLALTLYASYARYAYAFSDAESHRLVATACALIAWGFFLRAEAHYYSAKQAAIPWVRRTMVSGLLAAPIHELWDMIVWSPFAYLHILYPALIWITGNLFILVCLYFLWRWKFGLSRTDALNLAIAAMPLALVVNVAVVVGLFWIFVWIMGGPSGFRL